MSLTQSQFEIHFTVIPDGDDHVTVITMTSTYRHSTDAQRRFLQALITSVPAMAQNCNIEITAIRHIEPNLIDVALPKKRMGPVRLASVNGDHVDTMPAGLT